MNTHTFPSEPKLNMLVSSGPKSTELTAESCAGQPVICRQADISFIIKEICKYIFYKIIDLFNMRWLAKISLSYKKW